MARILQTPRQIFSPRSVGQPWTHLLDSAPAKAPFVDATVFSEEVGGERGGTRLSFLTSEESPWFFPKHSVPEAKKNRVRILVGDEYTANT